jgi:hypothetical protein
MVNMSRKMGRSRKNKFGNKQVLSLAEVIKIQMIPTPAGNCVLRSQ